MTRWSAITRTRGRRSALAYGSRSTTAAEDDLNRLVHDERGRYWGRIVLASAPRRAIFQRMIPLVRLTAFLAAVAVASLTVGGAANAVIPAQWKNCTQVNKKYPHGLGKVGARDKTSGVPVTTFKRSTRLYRIAMSYN